MKIRYWKALFPDGWLIGATYGFPEKPIIAYRSNEFSRFIHETAIIELIPDLECSENIHEISRGQFKTMSRQKNVKLASGSEVY